MKYNCDVFIIVDRGLWLSSWRTISLFTWHLFDPSYTKRN